MKKLATSVLLILLLALAGCAVNLSKKRTFFFTIGPALFYQSEVEAEGEVEESDSDN